MEININLATRPFIDFRPIEKRLRTLTKVLAVIAAGLAVAMCVVHQSAVHLHKRTLALDTGIASMTKERLSDKAIMHRAENVEIVKETTYLNQVFDLKSFSWTLVMKDLESVLPEEVEVSEIEPVRAKDGNITLRMRVIGPQDKAIEFVKRLETSQRFLSPRISGEFARTSGSPGQPVADGSDAGTIEVVVLAEYNAALQPILETATGAGDTTIPTESALTAELYTPSRSGAHLLRSHSSAGHGGAQ